jgi:hypothetical protein
MKRFYWVFLLLLVPVILTLTGCKDADNDGQDDDYQSIPLQSSITNVQPMTGIVLWTDSDDRDTDAVQLEYAYMAYNDIVNQKDQYDWSGVDSLLDQVAGRGHQAIFRFYYVNPGQSTTGPQHTTVPQYIKDSEGYAETQGTTEGRTTWFPDWSFAELQAFTLDFFSRFAQRYDTDPRLAFLQVGFGLWAEYHIYDGPMQLGKTFPSKEFQSSFLQHMDETFDTLAWSISIDAAETERSPFGQDAGLLDLQFGLFDDSFLHQTHDEYNADCFVFFDYQNRFSHSPMGGELNYYSSQDQEDALAPNGPHGIAFEQMAADYHISYMIGNDQPLYQPMTRIKEAGMATGYKFKITSFEASNAVSRGTIENTGIAPIYYDAFVTVNGVRSTQTLKGLLPGHSQAFTAGSGGSTPELTIESDRLLPVQAIEYEANLLP